MVRSIKQRRPSSRKIFSEGRKIGVAIKTYDKSIKNRRNITIKNKTLIPIVGIEFTD